MYMKHYNTIYRRYNCYTKLEKKLSKYESYKQITNSLLILRRALQAYI